MLILLEDIHKVLEVFLMSVSSKLDTRVVFLTNAAFILDRKQQLYYT